MATHQDYKKFAVKYNREFKIAGIHKMKKTDLINAIEVKLKKSRKEIRDEYKQLKKMVKEKKPKPAQKPKPKPEPKTDPNKITYNERTLQKMLPQLIGASIASDEKIYTKDEFTTAYQVADKVLTQFQAIEWKDAYDKKYKKPKPSPVKKPKKTPVKKEPKKKVVPKKAHNKFMKDLREQPINQTQVDKLDKPNINITKLEQLGFNTIAHYKQDGIRMKPLYISLNVSNPELLKPVEERKKAEPKPAQDEKVFTGSNPKLIKILKDDYKQSKEVTKFFDKENKNESFYVGTLNKITQKGNKLLVETKEGVKRTIILGTGKKTAKPVEDQQKLLEPVYKQLTKFIDDLKQDKSKITVAKLDKFYKDNKYNLPSDKKISSFDIVDNNRDLDFENIFIGGASIFLPLDIKQMLLKRYPSKSKIIKDKNIMEDLYYYLFADPRKLTTFIKDFYRFDNKIKNNLDKLTPEDTLFINDYLRFRSYLTAQKPFIVYNKFITDKLKKEDYKFDFNDQNIMSIMKRIKN